MRAHIHWQAFDSEHGWSAEAPAEDGTAWLLGPPAQSPAPFTEAIPSWSAATPAGSRIEIQLRARRDGRWTRFYRIAQWDALGENSDRRSFDAQADSDGRVATDTLVLAGPADLVQPRIALYATSRSAPSFSALDLALSAPGANRTHGRRSFAARELPIPPRSQMVYPDGGAVWCSPTALTMLLAYWHARTGDARLVRFAAPDAVPREVVPHVYDPVYEGHGNWGFNTAFAASCGLEAYVARLESFEQIAAWIAADVPVIISAAWREGALRHAAVPSSAGHLLAVAGFDERGRVIVADPAGAHEGEVRRVYDAAELEAAWQGNSHGAAYLIYPRDWPTPPPNGAPWR